MMNETHRATWATYQSAWEDVDAAERQDLLNRSVADDCVYTDPQGQTHGRAELAAYIAGFREAMPGHFFKNHAFAAHHDQSLAAWALYDAAGAEVQPGRSCAHYGGDGRITRVTGFF